MAVILPHSMFALMLLSCPKEAGLQHYSVLIRARDIGARADTPHLGRLLLGSCSPGGGGTPNFIVGSQHTGSNSQVPPYNNLLCTLGPPSCGKQAGSSGLLGLCWDSLSLSPVPWPRNKQGCNNLRILKMGVAQRDKCSLKHVPCVEHVL